MRDANDRYAPYKSRPEYQIAGLLDKYGLPFVYEKPTAVVDAGKTRIWYPDFTLAYGPLIEYFGVDGDRGYAARTAHKLKVYRQNQIQVLPVYPRDLAGRWEDRLLKQVDKALDRRLQHYRNAVRSAYRGWMGSAGSPYGRGH